MTLGHNRRRYLTAPNNAITVSVKRTLNGAENISLLVRERPDAASLELQVRLPLLLHVPHVTQVPDEHPATHGAHHQLLPAYRHGDDLDDRKVTLFTYRHGVRLATGLTIHHQHMLVTQGHRPHHHCTHIHCRCEPGAKDDVARNRLTWSVTAERKGGGGGCEGRMWHRSDKNQTPFKQEKRYCNMKYCTTQSRALDRLHIIET